jgi:YHS domain-containing protein
MLKYMLTMFCAVLMAGLGFAAASTVAADQTEEKPGCAASGDEVGGCSASRSHMEEDMAAGAKTVVLADAAATAPATQKKSAAVDVKNTKCIVTGEDVEDETFEYNGKIYHVCCSSCEKRFKNDPEKYIKDLQANPAKYGVK